VFDLGGVLIHWDPVAAVAAGVGEPEARRFFETFDFHGWNHALDAGGSIAEAEARVAAEAPEWGPHVRAYRAHFDKAVPGTLPDMVDVLRDLHARGVPVYALTNWPAELFVTARARFDFLGLFRDIVVSGEVGVAKPDPAVFEILRSRVREPFASCLYVDDAPVNVAAAADAGLDAVLFSGTATFLEDLAARGLR